jgi:integrase
MSEPRLKLYRGIWYVFRTVDGRTERTSLRTRDREEARRRLIDLQKTPAGDTVGALVEVYLADKDKTAIRSHDLHLAWKQARDHFAHLRPDQITREVCRAYAARRAGRSAATIRKELETVRAAVRFSAPNSGAVFELPPPPPHRDRFLTREEARRLLRASRSVPHIRAFISLSLSTAARSSAILDLTWDRVDFQRRMIRLEVGDDLDDARKSRARVPMNRRAWLYLRTLREAAMCDHVIEWAGRPVRSVKKGFAAAVVRAGLNPREITPHVLRHTAASWMVMGGVPIVEVSKTLGHSDSRITERVYAHMSPDYLQKAVKALRF